MLGKYRRCQNAVRVNKNKYFLTLILYYLNNSITIITRNTHIIVIITIFFYLNIPKILVVYHVISSQTHLLVVDIDYNYNL